MNAARNLILTLTPNPALDETYDLAALVPGNSHRVPPPLSRAGGKGLNVARVAHQLGFPALALAPLGGPTGAACRDELAAAGVPHRLSEVSSPTRRSMAFVDRARGLTTIINESGVPLDDPDREHLFALVERELPHAGCVVGSGSLPPGTPSDFYARLARYSAAAGVPCIVDASGPALLAAATAGVFAVKPNREELLETTGCSDVGAGADVLIRAGAKHVFVTSGSEGMRLFSAAEPETCLAASLGRVLRGNPTGAGDAAVAALAVLLAAGQHDPCRLIRTATAWSAAAVLMPVAGEISTRHGEFSDEIRVRRVRRHPPHREQNE